MKTKSDDLLGGAALTLLVAHAVLIILSWLLSAMGQEDVRSLLSSEGIRWFVGEFTLMLASPLLVWLLLALVALGMALFVMSWPKKKVDEVSASAQTEPVPQVVTVPDTAVIVQEHRDTVVMEQSNPVKQSRTKTKVEPVVGNPISVLEFDSIHQAYQDLYSRFEKEIQDGMKSGEIAYWDYGEIYKDRFALEMEELHNSMRPTDLAVQAQFEMDFKMVSEKLVSKLAGLYADKLPSIGWIGQDNPREADSLRIECQRFYFRMNRDLFDGKLPHEK